MLCHHLLSFSTYVANRLVPNITTFGYSLHSHLVANSKVVVKP